MTDAQGQQETWHRKPTTLEQIALEAVLFRSLMACVGDDIRVHDGEPFVSRRSVAALGFVACSAGANPKPNPQSGPSDLPATDGGA